MTIKRKAWGFQKVCEHCGATYRAESRRRRFCSKKCASSRPERRRQMATTMRALRRRPDIVANHRKFLTEDNPYQRPGILAKAQTTLRRMGYPMLKGGWKAPTEPQKQLASLLEWPMEWPIPSPDPPRRYLIDVANPQLKIAIEVDGRSHSRQKVKEQDRKKTEFLEEQGWTVLRFWNHEILKNPNQIANFIRFIISKRKPPTTSSTAS